MFTVHHRLERVEFVFWFLCCGQPFILVTCTHVHVATSTIDADQPDKNRSARFSFVCWRVHVNISHEARTRNIHLKLYLYSIYLSPSSFFNSIFFFYLLLFGVYTERWYAESSARSTAKAGWFSSATYMLNTVDSWNASRSNHSAVHQLKLWTVSWCILS